MDKAKPDLMAAIGTRRPAESKRILAQLEHGARAQVHPARAPGWTIDGWTIGLFALLLLMCSVAWLMHDQSITPRSSRPSSGSSTTMVARHLPPMPVSELPAEQAAAIVNEPSPVADAPPVAQASVPPSPLRAPAVQRKSAARTAAPTSNTAATAAQASDTDVTLLTALVAHTSKPTVVAQERSRDVVERQDGDTTVQLLARCKQLGLIEGMLCRSRICSGRWEADAACRAPNH